MWKSPPSVLTLFFFRGHFEHKSAGGSGVQDLISMLLTDLSQQPFFTAEQAAMSAAKVARIAIIGGHLQQTEVPCSISAELHAISSKIRAPNGTR